MLLVGVFCPSCSWNTSWEHLPLLCIDYCCTVNAHYLALGLQVLGLHEIAYQAPHRPQQRGRPATFLHQSIDLFCHFNRSDRLNSIKQSSPSIIILPSMVIFPFFEARNLWFLITQYIFPSLYVYVFSRSKINQSNITGPLIHLVTKMHYYICTFTVCSRRADGGLQRWVNSISWYPHPKWLWS